MALSGDARVVLHPAVGTRCGRAMSWGRARLPPGTGTPSASGLGPGGAVPGKVLGLPLSWAGPGHLGE